MQLEIDFKYGLFSRFPGTSWFGGLLGKGGYGELVAVGLTHCGGKFGKVILDSSAEFEVEVYGCKKKFGNGQGNATWKYFDPLEKLEWQNPGAKGQLDRKFIGGGIISVDAELLISVDRIPDVLFVSSGPRSRGLIDIFGRIEV